jgi:hypothetical protein
MAHNSWSVNETEPIPIPLSSSSSYWFHSIDDIRPLCFTTIFGVNQ